INHIWILGENQSDKLFYTSDNPVAMRSHGPGFGIDAMGIEIAFPLNPKYILILVDRRVFSPRAGKWENRLLPLTSDSVAYFNSLQVSSSYRQIYSLNNDFEVARQTCEAMPHLRKMNLPRAEVWSPDLETFFKDRETDLTS